MKELADSSYSQGPGMDALKIPGVSFFFMLPDKVYYNYIVKLLF